MFMLKFDMGSSAFEYGNRAAEIARILREVADKMEGGRTEGVISDINGNRVGEFYIDEDEDEDTGV